MKIIDSSIDVAGDIVDDALAFIDNPSFLGAVDIFTNIYLFGTRRIEKYNTGIEVNHHHISAFLPGNKT